jgi:hypothetical protein
MKATREECIRLRFQKHSTEAVGKLNTTLATGMTSRPEKISLYVRKQLLNDKNIEKWFHDNAPQMFDGLQKAFGNILETIQRIYNDCEKECSV